MDMTGSFLHAWRMPSTARSLRGYMARIHGADTWRGYMARIHGMVAQGSRHIGIARAAHQAEAGIAAGGEVGGRVADADLAGVLTQGHIAHPMQAVFDRPLATPQRQEPRRIGLVRRQAGQGARFLAGGLARAPAADGRHNAHSHPHPAADLPRPRPLAEAHVLVGTPVAAGPRRRAARARSPVSTACGRTDCDCRPATRRPPAPASHPVQARAPARAAPPGTISSAARSAPAGA
jgi:hypothetical protein